MFINAVMLATIANYLAYGAGHVPLHHPVLECYGSRIICTKNKPNQARPYIDVNLSEVNIK